MGRPDIDEVLEDEVVEDDGISRAQPLMIEKLR